MKKLDILHSPQITSFEHPHEPYSLSFIFLLDEQSSLLKECLESIANSFIVTDPNPATTRPIQCLFIDNGLEPAMEWILMKILTALPLTVKTLFQCFYHISRQQLEESRLREAVSLSSGSWMCVFYSKLGLPVIHTDFFRVVMDSMRFSNIAVIITQQESHKKSTQSTQHEQKPLSLASLSNPTTPEYRWDQLLFRRQLCKSITSSSHLTLQTLIQEDIWKNIIYFCESNRKQIIQLNT